MLKLVQPLLLPCASLKTRSSAQLLLESWKSISSGLVTGVAAGDPRIQRGRSWWDQGEKATVPLLQHTPPAGLGLEPALQQIDCPKNKGKAGVKCNNHVRGEKLEKHTTGSLNSCLVDKLLIERHYSCAPDSQKCWSCLEGQNKTTASSAAIDFNGAGHNPG